MKILILFLTIILAQITVNASVRGVLEPDPKCKGENVLFVAQKKNLYYQIHLPPNGSFYVDLIPGEYELHLLSKDGCFEKTNLSIKGSSEQNIVLKIKPYVEKTVYNSKIQKRNVAQYSMGAGFCPYCGGNYYSMMPQMSMPFSPWYSPYSYMNFGYPTPGIWGGGGCIGGYYSQGGGHMFGKPNIYFTGNYSGKVTVQVGGINYHLLASVPAPGNDAITFEMDYSKDKVSSGKTNYDYLFYDARSSSPDLQAQRGFCDERKVVLEKMYEILAEANFPKNAQKDFKEYWSYKFPEGKKFCVYPQGNLEMNKAIPLKVSVDGTTFNRLMFVVMPQVDKMQTEYPELKPFMVPPKEAWAPSKRNPASTNLHLYEWGISFPAVK